MMIIAVRVISSSAAAAVPPSHSLTLLPSLPPAGTITVYEFIKAMRELGLKAQPQYIIPVFNSIDKDGSGAIELKELERLLKDSVKKMPVLQDPAAAAEKGGKKGKK